MAIPKHKKINDIIENVTGSTNDCLAVWDFFKKRIGKVSAIECNGERITVTGSRKTLKLGGCNCGYHGTGPHGTAKILIETGMDEEQAEKIIGEKSFSAKVNYGSEEYSERDIKCPIPELDRGKLKEIANSVLDTWEEKEGKLPILPLSKSDKFRWGWQSPVTKVREKYFKELAKENDKSAARLKTAIYDLEAGWNASPCTINGSRLQQTTTCVKEGKLREGCKMENLKPPSQIEVEGLVAESIFTQEILKRMCNGKTCHLYRGWGGEIKDKIPTRPLSSWTFDEDWAKHVALCRENKTCMPGFVINKDIDIENIVAFSLAAGLDNAEMEAIVYHDSDYIKITPKDIQTKYGLENE